MMSGWCLRMPQQRRLQAHGTCVSARGVGDARMLRAERGEVPVQPLLEGGAWKQQGRVTHGLQSQLHLAAIMVHR